MKLRFLIPILLALAPAAFAQNTPGEGIQQVSASPTGACTVVSRMQYNYVAGNFWGCKNGTWTQVSSGGGSMTWPTTPGVAVCSGTPCTAWGTSLTAPVGSTALAGLGANTFTGDQTIGTTLLSASLAPVVLTDGATVSWSVGGYTIRNATLTLNHSTATRALNISSLNASAGWYTLKLVQDSTGGAAITLGTGCTWKIGGGGSGAITLSSAASAVDILAIYYDGTACYANFQTNFN